MLRNTSYLTAACLLMITAASLLASDFWILAWVWIVILIFSAVVIRSATIRSLLTLLCALLIPIALTESVWKLIDQRSRPFNFGDHYSGYYNNSHPLGYQPHPNQVVRAQKIMRDGTVVYDTIYTINSEGYRANSELPEDRIKPSILFFGGSFAFGEGLADQETLPAYVASLSEGDFRAFNFGLHGYGAHQTLRSLELGLTDTLDLGEVAAVVYVFISAHLERAVGQSTWDPSGPRYILENDGRLTHRGSFFGLDRWWIYPFQSSKIYRQVDSLIGPDEEGMIDLTAAILSRSATLVKERFGVPLTLLVWDDAALGQRLPASARRIEKLLKRMESDNFKIVFVSEALRDVAIDERLIRYDGHPSAMANRAIATALLETFATDQDPESTAGNE